MTKHKKQDARIFMIVAIAAIIVAVALLIWHNVPTQPKSASKFGYYTECQNGQIVTTNQTYYPNAMPPYIVFGGKIYNSPIFNYATPVTIQNFIAIQNYTIHLQCSEISG